MYFNSQSVEVIELSVLSCVPPPDFLNVWLEDETKPKLFICKLPPLPLSILLPPKDLNCTHLYPWKAHRELQ